MLDGGAEREAAALVQFPCEMGLPDIWWMDGSYLHDVFDNLNVATYRSLTHVAERSPLRVEIQDAQGFLRAVLLSGGQASTQGDRTVGNEEEELFRILDIGLDKVIMVVATAPVLVFAAGIVAFARPKKVVPVEGPLRVMTALPEVFDMLAVLVETALAVGAATALHRFKGGTDCLTVNIPEVIPVVPPMPVSAQARWRGNVGSIELVHGPNRSSGLVVMAGSA